MKLLEHEAKSLLRTYNVTTAHGVVIDAEHQYSQSLSYPVVVKAQVPVGGRGKAGGVRKVEDQSELSSTIESVLNLEIKGHRSSSVLIEEALAISQEYFICFTIDRATQSRMLLVHPEGGIDIEQVIESAPQSLVKIPIIDTLSETHIKGASEALQLSGTLQNDFSLLVRNLYEAFVRSDALLIEINPLVITKESKLVCADAKIELDDAAAFRHDWKFDQIPVSSQFVELNPDGEVASMANGAGLAMATVDAITAAGATPYNFLDIGGGTNTEGMVRAFGQIVSAESVKAIVVNVFAGITRCDEVAEAIIAARKQFTALPPLFIRLSGTREDEGKALLSKAGIATLPSLEACITSALQETAHV